MANKKSNRLLKGPLPEPLGRRTCPSNGRPPSPAETPPSLANCSEQHGSSRLLPACATTLGIRAKQEDGPIKLPNKRGERCQVGPRHTRTLGMHMCVHTHKEAAGTRDEVGLVTLGRCAETVTLMTWVQDGEKSKGTCKCSSKGG